ANPMMIRMANHFRACFLAASILSVETVTDLERPLSSGFENESPLKFLGLCFIENQAELLVVDAAYNYLNTRRMVLLG
ncbi:MAG: hypothetical protein ACRDEA_11425, partial [Microcystaceae cyanobacterium]